MSSSFNCTSRSISVETFCLKLECSTQFKSLISLMSSLSEVTITRNSPADRLFRAVSTQLDTFWFPDAQTGDIAHEDKQMVLNSLCGSVEVFMQELSVKALKAIQDETLEKLFRTLTTFLMLDADDFTDKCGWTPQCRAVKSLLRQFAHYDKVWDSYKHNQTRLITVIIGLMVKVSQTPKNEFNICSSNYSAGGVKGSTLDALAFMLSRFEWCTTDSLIEHIEVDKVLFACYRFMQLYQGDKLWSLNLQALSRVKSLVRFIAKELSDKISQHISLIMNDLEEKKLKWSSVVLIQYLAKLKREPVEDTFEALDISEEEEKDSVEDFVEEDSDGEENNQKEDFSRDSDEEDDDGDKDQCNIQ